MEVGNQSFRAQFSTIVVHFECKYKYPKEYRETTEFQNFAYPLYCRRCPENGGASFEKTYDYKDDNKTKQVWKKIITNEIRVANIRYIIANLRPPPPL